MKRFIVLLSILVLAFAVVACGNSAQAERLGAQETGCAVTEIG